MITAASRIATITFDGTTISIHRPKSGFVDRGTRTIPLDQISAIQFKDASLFSGGYLRLVLPGTIEHRGKRTGGTFQVDVLKDENAVPFGRAQQPEFDRLRDAIEQALAGRTTDGGAQAGGSLADELAKLRQLHDAGTLTAAEFEQAKARLLGR